MKLILKVWDDFDSRIIILIITYFSFFLLPSSFPILFFLFFLFILHMPLPSIQSIINWILEFLTMIIRFTYYIHRRIIGIIIAIWRQSFSGFEMSHLPFNIDLTQGWFILLLIPFHQICFNIRLTPAQFSQIIHQTKNCSLFPVFHAV